MALIRWEPTRELSALQNEMNRLFGTFLDMPAGAGGGGGAPRRQWIPAMDLVETAEEYVLRADLPGLRSEDVRIELDDNVLTLSGERKVEHEHEGGGYRRVERAFGAFSRSLTLPAGIDPERIRANFADGVLEVHIPRPEERKPRRVTIETTAGAPAQETVEGRESEQGPSEVGVGG